MTSTTTTSTGAVVGNETIRVNDLYVKLAKRVSERASPMKDIDLVVRLRDGIVEPHDEIVLTLFSYHIFKTNRSLYEDLKEATDEISLRAKFKDRVQTAFLRGERTITICTDMFPRAFLEILYEYVEYVDELVFTANGCKLK